MKVDPLLWYATTSMFLTLFFSSQTDNGKKEECIITMLHVCNYLLVFDLINKVHGKI